VHTYNTRTSDDGPRAAAGGGGDVRARLGQVGPAVRLRSGWACLRLGWDAVRLCCGWAGLRLSWATIRLGYG